MSCGGVGNIRIEPVNVKWEIEEQTHIACVADVSSSLQSKYFKIYNGSNQGFYVWFNVGGAGVDPAVANHTEVEVAISANASASAVATAMSAALDALAGFVSSASGSEVTVTNAVAGDADDTVDGTAATGFTFTKCQDGGSTDLGLLEGNVEVTFEEQLLEVTAHQTGTNLLAELRQGTVSEIALTLKECDVDHLKAMFARGAGDSYTPSGGTELIGWGTSRQGLSTIVQSRRLVLHPVRLDDSNKTNDLCFWKAYPMPESLVFSGEDPQTLGVTFKTYIDESKPSKVSRFAYGDWSQLVPVVP